MEKKRYTCKLAPALPSEKEDTNLDRMNRWERANNMKLKDLTDEEWIRVIRAILCITTGEAEAYLNHLRASQI